MERDILVRRVDSLGIGTIKTGAGVGAMVFYY